MWLSPIHDIVPKSDNWCYFNSTWIKNNDFLTHELSESLWNQMAMYVLWFDCELINGTYMCSNTNSWYENDMGACVLKAVTLSSGLQN